MPCSSTSTRTTAGALRDHLLANGVAIGEILDGSPGPERENGVADRGGYCLMIAQT